MTEKMNLRDIADRVLDGSEIDWQQELGKQPPDGGDNVVAMRNLRIVDTIARTLKSQSGKTSLEDLLSQIHQTFDPLLRPEPVSDEPLPTHWGKLEIRSLLGSGSFANVYGAFDPALQREVALKLFRSTDTRIQQRMLEEGRRMARIEHPNVVRVYGAEEHDDRVGIWMELLEGRTFEQLVGEDLFSAGEAALAGRELCRSLAAVHAAELIHSDIKPQNIIRRDDGHVLLMDFGSGVDFATADSDNGVAGTPLYLAPEILAGQSASVQSDVYSLGILLFHLVSGHYPVLAKNIPELKQLHDSGDRISLMDLQTNLPTDFIAVIEKAIAVDVSRRYQTMGEFGQALSEFLNEDSTTVKNKRPSWLLIPGVLLVALAAWVGTADIRNPAPTGTTYQLDADLYRIMAPGSREKLSSGSQIAVGDRLSLQLTASTEVFVYVFNEDNKGHAHALYPLTQLNKQNPLTANMVHQLPGGNGDQSLNWQVDSAGGIERIHIVTSPQEIPDIVELYAKLPPARLASRQSIVLRSRGVGTIKRSNDEPGVAVAPLSQMVRKISGNPELIEGVHYRVIELIHR